VANIEPGAEVRVRIRVVETVPYEAGVYQYTFPLVVGPRYIPGGVAPVGRTTPHTVSPTPAVPDAPRVTPHVLAPGFRSGHDVSIHVVLDAGVPIGEITSPSHRISADRQAPTSARLGLDPADRIPNKDFILRWSVSSDDPALGLLAHRKGIDGFFTLLVQPKGIVSEIEAAPKEILLVLDTSGSMRGIPLEASKRFVKQALDTMGPRDTFNLIRFAGSAEIFSDEPLYNDDASIHRALSWVENLRGSGGTEMLTGFRAALSVPPDPKRLRLVIFVTDGYIGNERQILGAISDTVGEARVFTLGIGSSVNHYLLDRMSRVGNGAYTFVRPDARANEAVDRFRAWVTKPYLTDLEIDWGALPVVDFEPEQPRDLFSGQTLRIVGRYVGEATGEIVVRGKLAGSYWEQRMEVELPDREEDHAALASIWARQRIRQLMLSSPGRITAPVEAQVTALALEYRLMSPFTSFVAVDDAEIANPDGDPRAVNQALPLPESVSFEGVFGPQGPPALLIAGEATTTEPSPEKPADPGAPGVVRMPLTVQVVDRNGPLPGATVNLDNPGHGKTRSAMLSDAHGLARFTGIPTGDGYCVEVSFPGFGTRRVTDIRIEPGAVEAITVQLAEEYQERVKVAAESNVVDLERTAQSVEFKDGFIQDLPAPGRFYQNVITLAPGVQDADGDGSPNVHGARPRHYKAAVGGVGNVDPLSGLEMSSVNPDSIEEMEVVTAGASVELSRAQGSARIVQGQGSNEPRPPRAKRRRLFEAPIREDPTTVAPEQGPLIDASLRVLADVAEDGRLSAAEGIPAVAALLAGQTVDGAISYELRIHALATWALAEAAAAMPEDPWIREATELAERYLFENATQEGWPRTPGGEMDAEATRWCLLVAGWIRPDRTPEVVSPPTDPSGAYGRLQVALAAARTGTAVEPPSGRRPFDRLVRAVPAGRLRVAG
jgi:hypothetical protein